MAALTKDRKTPYFAIGAARHSTEKVAANAKGFMGGLAAVDANGYIVSASDAAAIKVVGVFEEAFDNTGGANGDIEVAIVTGLEVELDNAGSAIGQAQMHKRCYAADDHSVTTAGVAVNDVVVGIVRGFTAATVCVYIDDAVDLLA